MENQKERYQKFVKLCLEQLKLRLGEEFTVQTNAILKNNSMIMEGVVILKDGMKITPNIYLEEYFREYENDVDMESIVDEILTVYQEKILEKADMDIEFTYEKMKNVIIYRLVNYEKNTELLKNSPYVKLLDLAITFHCLVQEKEEAIGTIRITNEHMKLWNVTIQDLLKCAKENTPRLLPVSIRRMEEVIEELIQSNGIEHSELSEVLSLENLGDNEFESEEDELANEMYILSNTIGINGAGCILYDGIMKNFAKVLKSDFYILPSSIHEVILLSARNAVDKGQLEEMVTEINQEQVPYEEVLSNHVYYYSKNENQIKCL